MILDVIRALQTNARERPDHPAIEDRGGVITYAELPTLVARRASHLRMLGLRPGDVLGVALKDNAEHVLCDLAAAWAGAATLPLDWRSTESEQQRLGAGCGMSFLLGEPGRRRTETIPGAAVDAAWHAAVAAASPMDAAPRSPDSVFFLGLSSGTTGNPSAAMITDRALEARMAVFVIDLGFRRNDRYLSTLPMQFGVGFQLAMATLTLGGTLIMFPTLFTPQELVAGAAGSRATISMIVPTVLRGLMALPPADRPLLDGLRALSVAGAHLHAEEAKLAQARVSRHLFEGYGSTPYGLITTRMPEELESHLGSVGRPAFLTEVEIVDTDHRPVPTGEIGHLRVRGPGLCSEIRNAQPNDMEGLRDGWFYPGDLGSLDARRFLTLSGRRSDLIKRGGSNVFPAEVERVLMEFAPVAEAAVVGFAAPGLGEDVAAFVVTRASTTPEAILAYCRRTLSPLKVPRIVRIVPELPKNAAGKVLKRNLASTIETS